MFDSFFLLKNFDVGYGWKFLFLLESFDVGHDWQFHFTRKFWRGPWLAVYYY
jgi:hypothetical protein